MSAHAPAFHFQFASAAHQRDTAIAGMWLFLATEVLLFGALLLCWIYARHASRLGFDAGAQQTALWIGTVNTVLLITSSATYSTALAALRANARRLFLGALVATLVLGIAFLALKFGLEWRDDLAHDLFPGSDRFSITGAKEGGARLFFVFYFIGTGLHGVHMLVGVGLVLWILGHAVRGTFAPGRDTPVQVVGLYWSFVDIVWLTLYPLIYLIGRATP